MALRNAFDAIALDVTLQAVRDEIGSISATPTTNTLQDRLKGLQTTITSLNGKDFATQTTLAAAKTVLDNILTEVTSLDGKDFATQTTLAGVLTSVDGLEGLLTTLIGKDFATETTLSGMRTGTDHRYSGGKTATVATVTALGDTTVKTPAGGKFLRIFWVYAINDPDQGASPLIKIKLGTTELYRGFAIAHWEVFDGAIGDSLVVNLDGTASVAVTAHYQEL